MIMLVKLDWHRHNQVNDVASLFANKSLLIGA